MVPELRALRFFTIGHMHVTVFWGFLSPKAGPLVMASITPASSSKQVILWVILSKIILWEISKIIVKNMLGFLFFFVVWFMAVLDLLAGSLCVISHQGVPVPQEGDLPVQHEPRAPAAVTERGPSGAHGALVIGSTL
jgi:hypothetical protein